MNNEKIQVKDQWSEKYLREQPFMGFGSAMNAFGLINEGKGMPLDEFLEAMEKIFKKVSEFTEESYQKVEKVD